MKSVLVALVALTVFVSPARALVGESPILNEKASAFAHRDVVVICSWLGYGEYGAAYPGLGFVEINYWFCDPLLALSLNQRVAPQRQGVGLISLAHELLHIEYPNRSEARTECVAYQRMDDFGALFTTDSVWLRYILRFAKRDHFALLRNAPQYNNKRKCRPNGAWDETPNDGRWP